MPFGHKADAYNTCKLSVSEKGEQGDSEAGNDEFKPEWKITVGSSSWGNFFSAKPQSPEKVIRPEDIEDFDVKLRHMQARLPQASEKALHEALLATRGHAGKALHRVEKALGCRAAGG